MLLDRINPVLERNHFKLWLNLEEPECFLRLKCLYYYINSLSSWVILLTFFCLYGRCNYSVIFLHMKWFEPIKICQGIDLSGLQEYCYRHEVSSDVHHRNENTNVFVFLKTTFKLNFIFLAWNSTSSRICLRMSRHYSWFGCFHVDKVHWATSHCLVLLVRLEYWKVKNPIIFTWNTNVKI